MNDVIGVRCSHCDPLIEVRVYGGSGDSFLMVVERVENGRVVRSVLPKLKKKPKATRRENRSKP